MNDATADTIPSPPPTPSLRLAAPVSYRPAANDNEFRALCDLCQTYDALEGDCLCIACRVREDRIEDEISRRLGK